jgi:hypothetical protein
MTAEDKSTCSMKTAGGREDPWEQLDHVHNDDQYRHHTASFFK